MSRRWTDRDGREWSVTLVEGSPRGKPPDPAEEDAAALEFRRGDSTRTVPTDRVADLGALEDGELQDLLERALEKDTDPDEELRDAESDGGARPARRGPGIASPDAAGRESAPHADPAKHGPATSD